MKRVPVLGSILSKAGTTTGPTSTRSSKKQKSKQDSASKGASSRFNYYHGTDKPANAAVGLNGGKLNGKKVDKPEPGNVINNLNVVKPIIEIDFNRV